MLSRGSHALPRKHLARLALTAFVLTFAAARVLVLLIMSRRMPDLYLHLGGTHVHHLNYGIIVLSAVGAVLLFAHPQGSWLRAAAVAYGAGLALTFDEFGMWLHLGGPYWQRASFDAIVVVAAVLALFAVAPPVRPMSTRAWATAAALAVAVGAFAALLVESLRYADDHVGPSLRRIEQVAPP